MDTAKKAQLEKRAVLGLAGVFVVVFAMGPMRQMLPRSPAVPVAAEAPPIETVKVKSIGAMMQDIHDTQTVPQADPASAPAAPAAPAAPKLYASDTLRDPLLSLLPTPPPVLEPTEAEMQQAAALQQPPLPPPELHIQGIVWGGSSPKAIINGRVYSVNERVDSCPIVAITRSGVTIEHEGKLIDYSSQMSPPTTGSGIQSEQFPQQAQWR